MLKKNHFITITILITLTTQKLNFKFPIIKKSPKTSAPALVTDFDVEKYMGIWYEAARTPNFFERTSAKNVIATYTLLDDGTVKVVNTSSDNGARSSVNGIAKFNGAKTTADLSLNFGTGFLSRLFQRGTYQVVGTDYENYAFVYTNERVFIRKRIFAWILTRQKNFKTAEDKEKFEEILDDFLTKTGVSKSTLIFPVQDDL